EGDEAIRLGMWPCSKILRVLQGHHSCSKKSARRRFRKGLSLAWLDRSPKFEIAAQRASSAGPMRHDKNADRNLFEAQQAETAVGLGLCKIAWMSRRLFGVPTVISRWKQKITRPLRSDQPR